jgi:hypothetical protein
MKIQMMEIIQTKDHLNVDNNKFHLKIYNIN